MNRHNPHHGDCLNLSWRCSVNVASKLCIGSNAIGKLPHLLSEIHCGGKVLWIKPRAPWTRNLNAINDALKQESRSVHVLELPDGEACKSLECLTEIWDALYNLRFSRQDTIVALGGGSILDAAGLAAATYMRGVKLVGVPTTLLAQVDAAVGGKTAINFHQGKNLLGAFYFAEAAIFDTALLAGLPLREFASGLAEVVKYSLIEKTIAADSQYQPGPRSLFKVLSGLGKRLAWDNPSLPDIIAACIKMKLSVVAQDPLDSGLRRCLNLGHTLGHALETASNFDLSHGEAVSIGMAFAVHMAVSCNQFPEERQASALNLLKNAGLPVSVPAVIDSQDLLEAIFRDKKKSGETIKMVLPRADLGCVDYTHTVNPQEVRELLISFRQA